MIKLSQQTLINVVNSRLGKLKLEDIIRGKEGMFTSEVIADWKKFMSGEDCKKVNMTLLLKSLGIVIKYGDGTIRTSKVLAKFKRTSAQEFIEYVNTNDIRTSIFRIKKYDSEKEGVAMDPIHDWVPDGIDCGLQDPYVALGID